MLNDQNIATTSAHAASDDEAEQFRDIHPLAPPPPPPSRVRRRETWETSSSVSSEAAPSEGFTTMSREFNALVLAGSTVANSGNDTGTDELANDETLNSLLARIREDDDGDRDRDRDGPVEEETNPLAIVPDNSGRALSVAESRGSGASGSDRTVTVERVKKEEVEAKIAAWQNAKAAKINNRFKREEAVISGLESEQVQKATSWMKKVERKLEEKRAKALEKMQNDVAKARRKAEERRASAEAKRGTKIARVLEIANLMRAVGRAPAKRSFF